MASKELAARPSLPTRLTFTRDPAEARAAQTTGPSGANTVDSDRRIPLESCFSEWSWWGYTKFQFLLCLSPIYKSVFFSPSSDATTTNHIGLHSLLYSTHLCLLSAILGDLSGNRNCFYTSSNRSREPAAGCTQPGSVRLGAVPWPGSGVLSLGLHQCREVLHAPAGGQEGARADGPRLDQSLASFPSSAPSWRLGSHSGSIFDRGDQDL